MLPGAVLEAIETVPTTAVEVIDAPTTLLSVSIPSP
jgi:hypothetical protein